MGQRFYAPGIQRETAPYQLQPEPNPVEAGEASDPMSPYKAPSPDLAPPPEQAAVAPVPVATEVTAKAVEKSPKMSFLSTIKADIKDVTTSAGKFAAAFSRLFKKLPSAIQIVTNFTTEVAPVISAAVALADPAAEPEVAGALAIVETGLAAIEASAQAATSGTSLQSALQNFSTTVPTLLAGLTIKNPVLQASVERIVALVVGETKVLIPAVESWVKQIEGSAPVPAAPTA